MTFRLTTLLYLFALLASSMAVLGAWGLLVGPYIFGIWWGVTKDPKPYLRWSRVIELLIALVLIPGVLIALLQPAVQFGYSPSRRTMSLNNLKNLSLAIQQYHLKHGHYPPPFVADEAGRPLYSWRVLLLPYLEQPALAQQFRYDEPWDSPFNSRLLSNLPIFQSPRYSPPFAKEELETGETHYFAVVGDGTIWDPNKKVTESDVTDGLAQTMLLFEVQGTGIKWSEPRDFTFEEAIALLEGTGEEWIDPGYFVSYRYDRAPQSYRCVAFADGRCDDIQNGKNPAELRALLTRAGGEPPIDLADLTAPRSPHYLGPLIHWGRIWGVACWVAIALLPLSRRLPIFPPPLERRDPCQTW